MKKFKDILNESIELHILNKICRYIELDMKKEGFDVYLFKLYDNDNSEFTLYFNFKYELDDLDDKFKNTLYLYETNAKNLLENIEKLRNYFKKYKKEDKDFYITKNNYTGLNIQINLKAEEIIGAIDDENGNEIKSILAIDKFKL